MMKMQDFMQKIKEKKLKRSDWLILVLAGILILIIALPTDTKGKKQAEEAKENISKENNTMEASKDELATLPEEVSNDFRYIDNAHIVVEFVWLCLNMEVAVDKSFFQQVAYSVFVKAVRQNAIFVHKIGYED